MTVLKTANRHFREDMGRAQALLEHADTLSKGTLREDILRSAWMFGVGALDAFFCDAYGDLVARTLQAKQLEPKVHIPERLLNLRVPAMTVIRSVSSDNWRWRMAARAMIEDESVLSFEEIKKLFNRFFRKDQKIFATSRIKRWIVHSDACSRMFGLTSAQFRALPPKQRNAACNNALEHLEERFQMIFQRRHDCIHNCDRPKVSPNKRHVDSPIYVQKILFDIDFFVSRCADEITSEFSVYLQEHGFSTITQNRVRQ